MSIVINIKAITEVVDCATSTLFKRPKDSKILEFGLDTRNEVFPETIPRITIFHRQVSHPLVLEVWILAKLYYAGDKSIRDGLNEPLVPSRCHNNILSVRQGDKVCLDQELARIQYA
jgi:hypothetical protein